MRRGTTPTHTFSLPFDMEMISKVRITYFQNEVEVMTKTLEDCTIEGSELSYQLTQEETLLFSETYNIEIQIKVLTAGNEALLSDVIEEKPERCLCEEIL